LVHDLKHAARILLKNFGFTSVAVLSIAIGVGANTAMFSIAEALEPDLKAVSGSYSGTVNADGTELTGTFIQGTAVLPLTFRRSPAQESAK